MAQLKSGVGASDTLFQHDRPNRPNRSRFDLSRITNFTADAGMIIPFDWFFCLPNDDIDIDFEFILDTLPLVNPSLTQYKVLTHWYAIDLKDLWEGFETFITRGRSGNVNLTIPQIDLGYRLVDSIDSYNIWFDDNNQPLPSNQQPKAHIWALGQHSLASFLGCPSDVSGEFHGTKTDSYGNFVLNKSYLPYTVVPDSGDNMTTRQVNEYIFQLRTGLTKLRYVSALPFMAYQNIVKYNYVNQNLLQNNHSLFPVKGDHDWFLPYDSTVTNFVDYPSNIAADADTTNPKTFRYDGVYTNEDTVTRLDQLRYAMFDDDYFTTGLPWLQRGTVSNIPVDSSDITLNIGSQTVTIPSLEVGALNQAGNNWYQLDARFTDSRSTPNDFNFEGNIALFDALPTLQGLTTKAGTGTIPSQSALRASAAGLLISVNALRESIALQVWQERNARVNGSYNAMIYQHWQSNPHGEEHKPHYIGGTADYVNFATILQSSQSTDDNPLGSTAGRGSTGGSAKVGHYHANDYSYVFGIMIIKPVTTYMQGVEHHFTEKVFDDFVQPEFEGLSPEPILNQELYISQNASDNTDLFAYQERYVYLKVRQNVNRGMFQCKPDKDRLFGSFTQARWFDSKPTFSYQFLCMSPDNLRRDWLAYPSMPAFKIQAASKVFVTRSLAYTSEPNTFGF